MAIDVLESPTRVQKSRGSIKAKKSCATPEQPPTLNGATTDSVTITSSAVKLQKLEQKLSELPVVDLERVEGLKLAIAKGQYEIDPARTADKFVRLETALAVKSPT